VRNNIVVHPRIALMNVFLITFCAVIMWACLFCFIPPTTAEGSPDGSDGPDEIHENEWRITEEIHRSGRTIELRGGAVVRPGGALVLDNCTLLFNESRREGSSAFRGLAVENGGELRIRDSFMGSPSDGRPYYIHAMEGSSFVLENATIEGCGAGSPYDFREGVHVETGDFVINDSVFRHNFIGLRLLAPGDVTNTIFTSNGKGLALRCANGSGFSVINCSFYRNGDVGLEADNARARIEGCSFRENPTGLLARGKNTELDIRDCWFIGNDYGIRAREKASLEVRSSQFDEHRKAAIYSISSGLILYDDNSFRDNKLDLVEEERSASTPFFAMVFLGLMVLAAGIGVFYLRKEKGDRRVIVRGGHVENDFPGGKPPGHPMEHGEEYDLPSASRFTEVVKNTAELAREMENGKGSEPGRSPGEK